MVVRIRRGVDLRFAGAPRQSIEAAPPVARVAILGADYPGLRFDVLAEAGETVRAGQPVLRDRKHPERLVVAPLAGAITAVTRGARRSIATVEISPSDDARKDFTIPAALDRDALCALLLESGLWAAIRARPFGRAADLTTTPEALFITAMDTRPHAPDPGVVIAAHGGWFAAGATALTRLTTGKTYLCQADGADIVGGPGLTPARFAGRHPAGLASTHIHHLHPVNRPGRMVWQVNYQEVIALGHLLETGGIWSERIVAVSGPALSRPALLRTPPGADLHQLLAGRLPPAAARVMSGSPIDGRVQPFLSRTDLQVFAAPHPVPAAPRSRLLHLLHTWRHAGIPALIPNAAHEQAAPIGLLPIPFLRALSVGDTEMAEKLGALELVEDDLALLSHVDSGHTDFGVLLRAVLDDLEGAR